MKGVVFTEFLEMVEDRFGVEVADRIIEASDLKSRGAYTAVGTYDHQELVQLVVQLSEATGIEVPDLIRAFGKHLFGRFVQAYPQFFKDVESAFAFLANVDTYVHTEVQKLYPEARLPTFECAFHGRDRLVMTYHSHRQFADLAEGLIAGCAEHFGEELDVQREDLSSGRETVVRFSLTCRVESPSV